jgi:acetoin utilization deacetylase AcuC-like enzyme
VVRVYYSSAYTRSGYAFDTTRKAQWVADSLAASPIPGIELVEPAPLTAEQIATIHDPGYVRAIQTGDPRGLAETQGFDWDPGLWPMVRASNGGVVAAARSALTGGVAGSLSSGLHHARAGSGSGFCTFNGLVLAADAALRLGADRVLILDLDAHCGGGTASLIEENPAVWQVDVSVEQYDTYPQTDRLWSDIVRVGAEYLPTIQRRLDELAERGPRFGLCIYNAGTDPHEDCPTGGLSGITTDVLAARERMVFEWCRRRGLPVAFTLAGGYVGPRLDVVRLVDLHRFTLAVAAEFDRATQRT